MMRKCEKCGHEEKNSPLGRLVDWSATMGLIHAGPIWPMKICPECKGIMRPVTMEHAEQEKCSVRDKPRR